MNKRDSRRGHGPDADDPQEECERDVAVQVQVFGAREQVTECLGALCACGSEACDTCHLARG